jgi:hypothetical protein
MKCKFTDHQPEAADGEYPNEQFSPYRGSISLQRR